MTCADCDDPPVALLTVAAYATPDHDDLEQLDDAVYCLYHFAHAHRAVQDDPCRVVETIDFATDQLDNWQPRRPTIYRNADPEQELKLLRNYLQHHPQDHPELHGRLLGVEAALDILQRNRRMEDITDHWPEPWKQRP